MCGLSDFFTATVAGVVAAAVGLVVGRATGRVVGGTVGGSAAMGRRDGEPEGPKLGRGDGDSDGPALGRGEAGIGGGGARMVTGGAVGSSVGRGAGTDGAADAANGRSWGLMDALGVGWFVRLMLGGDVVTTKWSATGRPDAATGAATGTAATGSIVGHSD